MSSVPCTPTLGSFIELGALPRQRDALGTDALVLVLFKGLGSATDTTLRGCATYGDMLALGVVVCNFTGYAPKFLGPADKTITFGFTSPYYWRQLAVATQTWNPAGGVLNNDPIKSALLYRPATTTALADCRALAICDTSGSAAGGFYEHTFSPLIDRAA